MPPAISWMTLPGQSEKRSDSRRPSRFGAERRLAGWLPGVIAGLESLRALQ